MRLALSLLLLGAALPALAGEAAACHPPLEAGHPSSYAYLYLDLGCEHMPPYAFCLRVYPIADECGALP